MLGYRAGARAWLDYDEAPAFFAGPSDGTRRFFIMSISRLRRLAPAALHPIEALAVLTLALLVTSSSASAQPDHRHGMREGPHGSPHRAHRPHRAVHRPMVRHRHVSAGHHRRHDRPFLQVRPVVVVHPGGGFRPAYPPGYAPRYAYGAPQIPVYADRPVGWRPEARWVSCAGEGGVCYLPHPTTVRYGAHGRYVQLRAYGAIHCSNRTFGDPIYGIGKSCSFRTR